MSGIWWWYLILGIAWIWYGMFVLSYRVGRLTAVAALVGAAFLFGGFGQLLVAGHPPRDDASPNVVPVGPHGVHVPPSPPAWPLRGPRPGSPSAPRHCSSGTQVSTRASTTRRRNSGDVVRTTLAQLTAAARAPPRPTGQRFERHLP